MIKYGGATTTEYTMEEGHRAQSEMMKKRYEP